MSKEISVNKAIGKTVSGIAFSNQRNQFAIGFADGTFTAIEIVRNGHCDDEMCPAEFDVYSFTKEDVVTNNIMSAEDFVEIAHEREGQRNAMVEQCERDQYERLKQKFEPNN